MTLLQCLREEFVRRDYAAPTIRSYVQIVEAFRHRTGARLDRSATSMSQMSCVRLCGSVRSTATRVPSGERAGLR